MYLIVGLGNPENEYAHTRHNMGFETINQIAKNNNIQITKNKFKGIFENAIIQNKKAILLKPQTYMNLSGESKIKHNRFCPNKNRNRTTRI